MEKITIKYILDEFKISKAYLYKKIKKENILIPKTDTGRYLWNEDSFLMLKEFFPLETAVSDEKNKIDNLLQKYNLKQIKINNRRYLGNKYNLSEFIQNTINNNCTGINIVADVFSGTGTVSEIFKDKMLITNDLLYCNFISNYAWFSSEEYSEKKIIQYIHKYNELQTNEKNYMRKNFANTFFSADDCSKIGYIREDIEKKYKSKKINFKEYAILITSLIYAVDKIANTVGHYDAYRKNIPLENKLNINVILPDKTLNINNQCFNQDATELVKNIECDLLYLDPPYNSRQYSDAYHLLENIARWEKPVVYGVAKKMDRSNLKSEYCMSTAAEAFEKLVKNSNAKYIMLSYNNMAIKGNERSNAKMSDKDIIRILESKGKVTVFEERHKSFSTGKSIITDNIERLFLCEVARIPSKNNIACPFNYTGGKYKLLKQIKPLLKKSDTFLDLFSGGANVGINSEATKLFLNDKNHKIIGLIEYMKNTPTDLFLKSIDEIISKYNLSTTAINGYESYGCDSSEGLAKYNKNRFLKLREEYNKKISQNKEDYELLYTLIVFSFNNQIRFNKNGEFNLPVGKRDFNIKMRQKFILYSELLKKKDIRFSCNDFRNINLDDLPKDTFIYCDPPYLITTAPYNESGMWTENDENDLLSFLDEANKKGFKFALSNVLEIKNLENKILKKWINSNKYTCTYLNKNYNNSNYQKKDKLSNTVEVLITNYNI